MLLFLIAGLLLGRLGKQRLAAQSQTSRALRRTARSSPRRRGRFPQDSWILKYWPKRSWRRPKATCRPWRACRKPTSEHWRDRRGERKRRAGSLPCRLPQPRRWLPPEVHEGSSPQKPVHSADHPAERAWRLAPLPFPSLVTCLPCHPPYQRRRQLGPNLRPAPHRCRKSAPATAAPLSRPLLYLFLQKTRVHLSPPFPRTCIRRLSLNSDTRPPLTPHTSHLPTLPLTAPLRRRFHIPPQDPFQPPRVLRTPPSWAAPNTTTVRCRRFMI